MTEPESTLLVANLTRVFSERDAARRRRAVAELYSPDAKLYEPGAVSHGPDAISAAVGELLQTLPTNLGFSPAGPVLSNHSMHKLAWRGVLPDGTTVATGTDVAVIEDGHIRTIHVFLDPPQPR